MLSACARENMERREDADNRDNDKGRVELERGRKSTKGKKRKKIERSERAHSGG